MNKNLINKPTIPDIIPLLREFYARPGNECGGHFHAILEDGNHEKCFAKSALTDAKELGDPLTIRLAEVLVEMSSTQRWKLAHCSFLWTMSVEAIECQRQSRKAIAVVALGI